MRRDRRMVLVILLMVGIGLSISSCGPVRTPGPVVVHDKYKVELVVNTPTQPAPPTLTPTNPPLPTETPLPTDTPEPEVSLAWMKMMFWETWFGYDPNIWQPGGHQYMPAITHQQIPQCVIREQGPTEYPYVSYEIDLGDVHYQVAEFIHSDTHADWYMATRGPHGPFAGGLPSLVVNGTINEWATCLADAQVVLATMTEMNPSTSSSSSSISGYFTCQGALSPRLWVDGYAYVSYDPPLSNRVRTGPGTNYSVVGMIAPGKAVKIIGGPECANGWVWWKIQVLSSGLIGWTAEGDAPEYWLIPCASATYCGR